MGYIETYDVQSNYLCGNVFNNNMGYIETPGLRLNRQDIFRLITIWDILKLIFFS